MPGMLILFSGLWDQRGNSQSSPAASVIRSLTPRRVWPGRGLFKGVLLKALRTSIHSGGDGDAVLLAVADLEAQRGQAVHLRHLVLGVGVAGVAGLLADRGLADVGVDAGPEADVGGTGAAADGDGGVAEVAGGDLSEPLDVAPDTDDSFLGIDVSHMGRSLPVTGRGLPYWCGGGAE